MKKNISLMINLLLASTLFWGVPLAYGEELNSEEMISTVPAELPSYCHIKSPAMREDSLGARGLPKPVRAAVSVPSSGFPPLPSI